MTVNRAKCGEIFRNIATQYDLVNTLMTLGLHHGWRDALVQKLWCDLPQGQGDVLVLDLATGTGDVAMAIGDAAQRVPSHSNGCSGGCAVVAVDRCEEMLRLALIKAEAWKENNALGSRQALSFVAGDAAALPFRSSCFDACTVAFGLRNFEPLECCLEEVRRVLRPSGRLLVLECSRPAHPVLRLLHGWYMRWVVPCLGWAVTGDYRAYRYLNDSVAEFPSGEELCVVLRRCGFTTDPPRPMLLGAVTLYSARVPPHEAR
eukprot:RCo012011